MDRAAQQAEVGDVDELLERPRVVRMTAAQRREQLLGAAAELLLERGFDGLTMEAVAQQAGASKTLGYAYFANADDLVLSLWSRELGHLFERAKQAAEGAKGFRNLFTCALRAYYDVVEERGLLLSVLQAGVTARRLDRGNDPETSAFIDWLAEQLLDSYDVEPGVARQFAVLAASVPSIDATGRHGSRHRDRDMEQRCLDFVLAGIDAALPARS